MDAMSCQTQSRIDEVEQHRCWSGGAGHLDGKVRVAAMQFCGVLDNLWGIGVQVGGIDGHQDQFTPGKLDPRCLVLPGSWDEAHRRLDVGMEV